MSLLEIILNFRGVYGMSQRFFLDRQLSSMGVHSLHFRHGFVSAYVDTGYQHGVVSVPLRPFQTAHRRLVERVASARPLGLIE
jgi:hypothetical protein